MVLKSYTHRDTRGSETHTVCVHEVGVTDVHKREEEEVSEGWTATGFPSAMTHRAPSCSQDAPQEVQFVTTVITQTRPHPPSSHRALLQIHYQPAVTV